MMKARKRRRIELDGRLDDSRPRASILDLQDESNQKRRWLGPSLERDIRLLVMGNVVHNLMTLQNNLNDVHN